MHTFDRVRKPLVALGAAALITLGIAACGSDDSSESTSSEPTASGSIERNEANSNVSLTIGSKNFTEQIVLGEIYAQALEAAGYDVKTDLNLGDENIALKALEEDEISGYPEYISTALTSFFGRETSEVPKDAEKGAKEVRAEAAKKGLVVFGPTPFASANAVGMLASRAEELGVEKISDLEGVSEELKLYGTTECRQRIDCLLGLQQDYGLEFESFTPVDSGLRYEVLDNGQADVSIVFTTDPDLSESDDYTTLEDDLGILPSGNVVFMTREEVVDQAGPDYQATIELVQENLTEEVIQELSARIDFDKEKPAEVAADYLSEAGYTG